MSSVTIENTRKADGSNESSALIHATTIFIKNHGVLLIGASGSGKSDLALRLIDRGAILVSDDYSLIEDDPEKRLLVASPPSHIAGLLEIRGVGIVKMPFSPKANLALAVILDDSVERMPDPADSVEILGRALPLLTLKAFEASTPIKIEMKIACLQGDILLKD
ncbi:HPr kinase/phosphorylase [Zymomonas mobilis]|uniref:HPr kinase n=1 Tax=Zymomonas mobilis subsp. mobilis (strain ATCC 10988 / DSM 424 / LMG 404 / NCIMB 8938 / NRRL B-806 / ZM1) TaxID=555217 RepID=A0A0H3FVQ4_ZYMMA|nr:HPr kinase/phosphatase C-terminal domain-containing protein [Zymomonas mobilis]AEH61883.1 HPr kinase [Zymomonas mobilis subsp. mobilis ATCC 10988]AHB09365.1 Hpr(Ser) kinase/phosphatase [Zymomonas mobilis subsp. mobilis str. CP4 = NRRL B-14023]AHJ69671.1 HPr kinase/phosphorylase [Zymomonas mobilis subsp. mobilis NRRL B-12526]AHJ71527.1 HPr kinase/phosphorylase [Zymomonas mobilis subsp. mobilis str. CP4 = NRRL B-14023]ART94172.1 aldolase [Zymomonas mobilis subsp. mobilis]